MRSGLPRVVVTGYGCVTPVGRTVRESFESIMAGQSNFRQVKDIPFIKSPENYPQDQYMSAIGMSDDELAKHWDNFNPTRSNAFLLMALGEALAHAKLTPELIHQAPERVGVSIGALSSNLGFLADAVAKSAPSRYSNIHRFTMMNVLNNILGTSVSVKLGTKGPMLVPATACATGLSAIGEAFNMIRLGYADQFICGAAEEILNPVAVWGPTRLGTLNKTPNHGKICAPFDKDRNGIILGEAGAVVVIETLENANKRGAAILAEIVDFGMSSDGFHYVKPEPSGEGGLRAMRQACQSLLAPSRSERVTAGEMVVNAHATGTVVGDKAELQAIGRLAADLGATASTPLLVTANKGNFGHCFSAAGTVETIMGIEGLIAGTAPPINYFQATEDGQMPPGVDLAAKPTACPDRTHLVKSSFGFGGVNCAILIKKHQN